MVTKILKSNLDLDLKFLKLISNVTKDVIKAKIRE